MGLRCCLNQLISCTNATTSTDRVMKLSCDGTTPPSASIGVLRGRCCLHVMRPRPCSRKSRGYQCTASNAYTPNGRLGQVGGALRGPLSGMGTVVTLDRSQLDLSLPESIPRVLSKVAPDLIVNPAAYTAVDRAEDEVEIAYRVNAAAPGKIAAWASTRDIPLIHFSTDYAFDGSGQRPWREQDPTGPLSVYGASKLAGEVAIREAQGPHLIVRTSWVYAAHGTNFLNTIIGLSRE